MIGAAALVLAVAILLLVWRRGLRSVNVRFGNVEAQLSAVQADTTEVKAAVDKVNRAVNQVPPGTPTLVERVSVLETMQAWKITALQLIADQVGVRLPSPPPRSGAHHDGGI